MIGYKLTIEQANILRGNEFADGQEFNPVPDINGDDFIFEGEVNGCKNEKYMWVKELKLCEYVPPLNNQIIIK